MKINLTLTKEFWLVFGFTCILNTNAVLIILDIIKSPIFKNTYISLEWLCLLPILLAGILFFVFISWIYAKPEM